MENPLKIKKSFRIKHKILEILYKDWEENEQTERMVGSIKIANKANILVGDIHRWQGPLVQKGEITASDTDGQIMMSIQLEGRNAYIEKKYLLEGRKERWDGVWDWARILIPVGALLLSIINFISNRNLSDRIKNIEQKMEQKNN